MKELMTKELIDAKNNITASVDLSDIGIDYEDSEVVVKILNMLNEKNYLISEATTILNCCIETLKRCPVIKYKNY